jgi:hypothetical protein
MLSARDNWNMTRREWMAVAAAAVSRDAFAATDFWNRKPVAEWTSAEIVQLRSASPWARTMNIQIATTGLAEGTADPSSQHGQRDPTSPPSGTASIPMGEKRKSGPARGHIIVRWESAAPVRDAMRTRLPAEFDGHYVISVEGIDPGMLARPNVKEGIPELSLEEQGVRLKEGAQLELRDKEPLPAGIVTSTGRISKIWWFGFSRELFPITTADRDLGFAIKSGAVRFRADFPLREMMYKGALAV